MSSDGYFEEDDLNDEGLEQLNAIEAAAFATSQAGQQKSSLPSSRPTLSTEQSFDLTFDIDEKELEKLDEFVRDVYEGTARPAVKESKKVTHQTTLFGDLAPSPSAPHSTRSQIQRSKSSSSNVFGQHAPKTKVWDHTVFAKTGMKLGKAKAKASHDNNSEDEQIEFEQFPAPAHSIPIGPPPPMKLTPDLLEAKHWIYPMNQPKRDYQYNIAKHCLFENSIVALPTGLGKTFIAGVIMLNYYRWFPEGKVVFVAPTKPLVAQQIEACHQTCGIPGCDAVELTGQIMRSIRGRCWKEKRVFYMTPQTLVNDLATENCDPRSIVLIVIDEAHRATGDYAYNQVVRFMMAKNPHFRLLALTATPGGNPEAVQNLIDGLHISHIEIRDENSLDLRQYIQQKKIEQHIINMTEDINQVKSLLSVLMDKDIKPLKQRGVLRGAQEPAKFHPYSAQARMAQLTKDQKWAYAPLSRLASLARAMGYLIEGTMGMCYTYLQSLVHQSEEEPTQPGKSAAASRKKTLVDDPMFKAVLRELDSQHSRGFADHPKMDNLKTIIVQHFAQRLPNKETKTSDDTRAMVFVTFREAVDEIVEALNFERPLVRPHKFIGQGTDKQGKKGLAQKEQLDIIKRFKAGEFNVLVATSIGEEGLDIGEVDLIVCYDAQKTPIRMLQRLGRTGRKRAGVVHVLLAEGREELNLEKAKVTYKEVQKTIWRGEQLEFYSDVSKLLPAHIKPECLEKKMEIQEYVREEGKKKTVQEPRSPAIDAKRKRNDDMFRNIPTGASTGFVNVSDLLLKGTKGTKTSKKRKAAMAPKDFDIAGEDDDTDMDIESGVVGAPPRRAKSDKPPSKKTSKSNLKRSKTSLPSHNKKSKAQKPVESSSSQFSNRGLDDVDDLDIGCGHISSNATASTSRPHDSLGTSRDLQLAPTNDTNVVIDLTISEDDRSIHTKIRQNQSMAWLVAEDEDPKFEIVDSSPITNRRQLEATNSQASTPSYRESVVKFKSVDAEQNPQDTPRSVLGTPMVIVTNSGSRAHLPMQLEPSSPSKFLVHEKIISAMPPPKLTKERIQHEEPEIPTPSFPVRSRTNAKRRLITDSSGAETTPSPPRRLRRLHRPRSKTEQTVQGHADAQNNPFFDFEAIHSGDEVSQGSSGPEEVEDESDRLFVHELPETQVSPSYDQTLAYRQSLFTQAPAGTNTAPSFATRPVRRGNLGNQGGQRPRLLLSSSPPREDSEPDEYAFGSFVVDDEADISYHSS